MPPSPSSPPLSATFGHPPQTAVTEIEAHLGNAVLDARTASARTSTSTPPALRSLGGVTGQVASRSLEIGSSSWCDVRAHPPSPQYRQPTALRSAGLPLYASVFADESQTTQIADVDHASVMPRSCVPSGRVEREQLRSNAVRATRNSGTGSCGWRENESDDVDDRQGENENFEMAVFENCDEMDEIVVNSRYGGVCSRLACVYREEKTKRRRFIPAFRRDV